MTAREGRKISTQPCSWCGKRFARAEHLLRHQRIHTQETPFSCPYCRRNFQRSDVRNRHIAKYCTAKSPQIVDNPDSSSDVKTSRAKVACDSCHARKLKCTGTQPCSHCTSASKDCLFSRAPVRNYFGQPHPELGDVQPSEEISISSEVLMVQPPRAGNVLQQQPLPETPILGVNSNPFEYNHPLLEAPQTQPLPPHMQQSFSNSRVSADAIPSASPHQQHHVTLSNVLPASNDDFLESNPGEHAWNADFGEDSMTFMDNIFDLFPSPDQIFPPYQSTIDHSADSMVDIAALVTGYSVDWPLPSTFNETGQRVETPPTTRATFPQINSDASKWLKIRPSIKNHDRIIVNHFLNLFVKHLPATLHSFSDFAINDSTREEAILATAAVGGLYSGARGSHLMSRAMCADGRRLFLLRLHVDFPLETMEKVDVVKTFMLLEIFGIFSGDKRMCELSEAFHAHLLQIVARCGFPDVVATPNERRKIQSVCKDLQILECYRTIILECPPNLYLTSRLFSRLLGMSSQSFQDEPLSSLMDHVALFLDPSKSLTNSIVAPEDAYSLASLLVLSSHAVPTRSPPGATSCLWDKRVFELALNRWLHSQQNSVDDSTMMLFHLGFIVLHVNMSSIHGAVREMSSAGAFSLSGSSATARWQKSDDCEVVTLHANQIIEIASRIGTLQRSKHGNQSDEDVEPDEQSRLRHDEAPHVAICLYLAVIVLWVAQIANESKSLTESAVILNRGTSILRRLNMWLARGLGKILQRLEDKCLVQGETT